MGLLRFLRKFNILILKEDESEYNEILSNELNKLSLQNKGIYFYSDTKELTRIVKEIIVNKE